MGRNVNVSRDDWVAAAFEWIAANGVATLAVEPLARSLGVSKGGFYWCFASRDELLAAVLERWEQAGTQEIIDAIEQLKTKSPLRELLGRVALRVKATSAESVRALRMEHALNCAATDPRVAPVVQRVTAARVGYLAKVMRGEGLGPKVARQRAMLAHASYLGLVQLRATGNDAELAALDGDELLEAYLAMVLAPSAKAGAKRATVRKTVAR